MAIHTFKCDSCRISIDDDNTKMVHVCPKCGGEMYWDLGNLGICEGDYRHVSNSLAMNPDQIAEHKGHFPDIEVLPDGRPMFTSPKQQERYLDATGFYKETQKIKVKGEKINPK